jgi:hypothetical protein
MQVWQAIAIGVVILAVVGAAAWFIYQRNRTRHLRARFGPEYDRRIAAAGSRSRAEAELTGSEIRAKKVKVQPLSPIGALRRRTTPRIPVGFPPDQRCRPPRHSFGPPRRSCVPASGSTVPAPGSCVPLLRSYIGSPRSCVPPPRR